MISEVKCMDNMEYMAQFPDKFFELAIVDPPYGIGIAKRNGSIGQKKAKVKLPDTNLRNGILLFHLLSTLMNFLGYPESNYMGGNYFTIHLPPSMGWIVWDKLQPEGVSFAMAELAFTSFEGSIKTFKTSRANMQNCVSNNDRIGSVHAKIHPTQKPVALYRWLMSRYGKPGIKFWILI